MCLLIDLKTIKQHGPGGDRNLCQYQSKGETIDIRTILN